MPFNWIENRAARIAQTHTYNSSRSTTAYFISKSNKFFMLNETKEEEQQQHQE